MPKNTLTRAPRNKPRLGMNNINNPGEKVEKVWIAIKMLLHATVCQAEMVRSI